MARLRASLARSAADRDLHQQISQAVRYVARAQDVCVRVSRNRDPMMQMEVHRARALQQTLKQVRTMLDRVGFFEPGYDRADPDLIPEIQKRPVPVPKKASSSKQILKESLRNLESQGTPDASDE